MYLLPFLKFNNLRAVSETGVIKVNRFKKKNISNVHTILASLIQRLQTGKKIFTVTQTFEMAKSEYCSVIKYLKTEGIRAKDINPFSNH